MKQVYQTGQITHIWAHGRQPSARNPQGNLSVDGALLMSYREPIARRIVKKCRNAGTLGKVEEKTIFLLRNRRFTSTTNKHQSEARQAVFGFVFHVAHVGGRSSWEGGYDYGGNGSKINHKRNLKDYKERIDDLVNKLRKARNTIYYLNRISSLVNEANSYASCFKFKTRFASPLSEEERLKLHERGNKHSERMEEIRNRKTEENRKIREAREAELREKEKENVGKWIAGKNVSLRYQLNPLMRVEGEEVVTTLGARVPLSHVTRILPRVLRMLGEGKSWKRNGETMHVGHFQVDEVDGAGGFVVAGCHRFTKVEVERFASTLPPQT